MVMARAQVWVLSVPFVFPIAGIIAVLANLTKKLPATLVAVVLAGTAASIAWSQQPMGMPPGVAEQPPVFHVYTLRNARAADAYVQLVQLLSALPIKTDVVVDERGNRLLVSGTAQAHEIVQRLVDSIDRPQAVGPNPAAMGPPVVEGYPVPAEHQPILMGELRARFPAYLNVRMAP